MSVSFNANPGSSPYVGQAQSAPPAPSAAPAKTPAPAAPSGQNDTATLSKPEAPTNARNADHLAALKSSLGTDLLSNGTQGSNVKALQSELAKQMGGGLKADGKFGPQTQDAVKQFQKQHGIKVDGLVGPETRAALESGESSGAEGNQQASGNNTQSSSSPNGSHGSNISMGLDGKPYDNNVPGGGFGRPSTMPDGSPYKYTLVRADGTSVTSSTAAGLQRAMQQGSNGQQTGAPAGPPGQAGGSQHGSNITMGLDGKPFDNNLPGGGFGRPDTQPDGTPYTYTMTRADGTSVTSSTVAGLQRAMQQQQGSGAPNPPAGGSHPQAAGSSGSHGSNITMGLDGKPYDNNIPGGGFGRPDTKPDGTPYTYTLVRADGTSVTSSTAAGLQQAMQQGN